jgi:tetratricopeptide (TPR) repeat protein
MNEEAFQSYKKALEIDPDFELAKRNIKVVMEKLGKRDTTIEDSERLFKRIEDYIRAKDWQSALKDSERLVKLIPGSFMARFYLANIYFTIGRLPDAASQYEEALKLEPANPAVWGNLGLLYIETKNYELARKSFKKVLEFNPDNQVAKEKLLQLDQAR